MSHDRIFYLHSAVFVSLQVLELIRAEVGTCGIKTYRSSLIRVFSVCHLDNTHFLCLFKS